MAAVVSLAQAVEVERHVSGHRMEVEAVHGVHMRLVAAGQSIAEQGIPVITDVVTVEEALRL